jgi:hypothetical protein
MASEIKFDGGNPAPGTLVFRAKFEVLGQNQNLISDNKIFLN